MALRKFIIERDIPKVGTFEREQLRGAAAKSNGVLRQLGTDIQWVESYVADNKTFCVYLARDEEIIRKHAEMSGFPATKVTEVRKMIDPTTERQDWSNAKALGLNIPHRLLALADEVIEWKYVAWRGSCVGSHGFGTCSGSVDVGRRRSLASRRFRDADLRAAWP
jgi:Protein of unknown function (DUF4242)